VREHAHAAIKAASEAMSNTVYTAEVLYDKLFALVLECTQPKRTTIPTSLRRTPIAGEVLPPEQRASWTRHLTAYNP
jgi:hypothetical protein